VQRRLRAAGVRWEVSHMASSWHLLKGRELHMDLVRLGAALYGQQRWLTRIARIKKARLARRPRVSGGLLGSGRRLRRCCTGLVLHRTGGSAARVQDGCPRAG